MYHQIQQSNQPSIFNNQFSQKDIDDALINLHNKRDYADSIVGVSKIEAMTVCSISIIPLYLKSK